MDRRKLIRLFHTVRYLKPKQVYYRFFYLIRNRFSKNIKSPILQHGERGVIWSSFLKSQDSYLGSNTFTFLNLEHKFENNIDWNHAGYGKLWTYNLNYFDYLHQPQISKEDGLNLISQYVDDNKTLKDGLEPYPISLRGINWIKFLSLHSVKIHEVDTTLYQHYHILLANIEYHLLGNHLLENGFSLLFGAYYFKEENFYIKAKQILGEELSEQILEDGGHFELSSMYHQILLYRLLDAISLIKNNSWKSDGLVTKLIHYADKMLSWLDQITYSDGSIPMMNDATYDIAPSSDELFPYAQDLGLEWSSIPLSDSGYRKFAKKRYESVVDVGQIEPNYIPGHAHADTFNFEIHVDNKPFIVDTGISTYEKNERRHIERSTSSHNTVVIGDQNQSDVWGGFRVGERAKIVSYNETGNTVSAVHDGYKNLRILHKRTFSFEESKITISDNISGNKNTIDQKAYLHFHPDCDITFEEDNNTLKAGNTVIEFENALNIHIDTYMYALGYNRLTKAQLLIVEFTEENLKTSISITDT